MNLSVETSINMIIHLLDYYDGSMIGVIHFSRIRINSSFYSTGPSELLLYQVTLGLVNLSMLIFH